MMASGTGIEEAAKDIAKEIIFDRLRKWYHYIKNYDGNIKKLKQKHEDLINLRKTIVSQIQHDEYNLRRTTDVTKGWLNKVDKLLIMSPEDNEDEDHQWMWLLDKENRKGKEQCCFGCLHCNVYQRYEMSKTADEIATEIDGIVADKPENSMITEPLSVSELKPVPGEFLTGLESRVKLMEEVLEKLQDDEVNVVGIFGMGAIGKTTLAKEIAKNQTRNKFDKTVMVEISEAPNMERIQHQIAEQLGLYFDHDHGVEQRATRLYNRLTERGSKILVILDNIWEKLDLSKVGVPVPQQRDSSSELCHCCCKLMVTSRTKEVCKVMGVKEQDILQVNPLVQKEARLLFRARVGKMVGEEHKEVENRILNKCQGLPLSIVALADVLKDQEFSMWEHYATEIEKPASIHGAIRGVNSLTYSILETSYKLMESDEKRSFFLLACLFPFGSSIPVKDMMRYGIGMELFQEVDNLSEAMEQANTWVDELKSSSLLLEHEWAINYVKIHDVVRASMIALAKNDGHLFMVEAFPRWRNMNTCQKYTAISLMHDTNHSRLCGLKSDKLEILILDKTQPPEFDDSFFQHMTNLKVLVLKGMTTESIHGNSMGSCLRTLHLEECALEDIGGIRMLTMLEVLSLSRSSVKELPVEAMRKLCNLRVLDLTLCHINTQGISFPANVLSKLPQLEGLYTRGCNIKWVDCTGTIQQENTPNKYAYASIDELNELRYLNVLEMDVKSLEGLPNDDDMDQFVSNLERFHVELGNKKLLFLNYFPMDNYKPRWSRVVQLDRLDMRSVMGNKSAKALLHKTQQLILNKIDGLEHVSNHHQDNNMKGRFEFRGVKDLYINMLSSDYDHDKVVESIKWSVVFPNLESLLMNVGMKRTIGWHDHHQGEVMFPKLQRLQLRRILMDEFAPNLMAIDAVLPHNLTYLDVATCWKVKHIFWAAQNRLAAPHALPSLKFLQLSNLIQLQSMVEVPNSSTSSNFPALIRTSQLIFGALEEVQLEGLLSIVTVWDMNLYPNKDIITLSFCTLKKLTIKECENWRVYACSQ